MQVLSIAVEALKAHKLRSFLTLLGVIIGVMTVVSVVSVISGLNNYVSEQVFQLNPDVFVVSRFGIITSQEEFLEAIKNELVPELARRMTATPVVPPGARHATLNINSIAGGQAGQMPQSPCVADRCEAIFDRRFLLEEGFDKTKEEVKALLDRVAGDGGRFELEDLMSLDVATGYLTS